MDELFRRAERLPGYQLEVDLEAQTITELNSGRPDREKRFGLTSTVFGAIAC